jgi:hypothetical protein
MQISFHFWRCVALYFDKTPFSNIKTSSRRHSQEHLSGRQRMDIQSSELADDFPEFGRLF